MTLNSFDYTFDGTFRPILSGNEQPPVQSGCRKPGAYLTWLGPHGWLYWLFEGKITREKAVISRGQSVRAGVIRHSQKESAPIYTIRTAGLTEQLADIVSTVYESTSVYLLAVDEPTGAHVLIPVSIEPLTVGVWYTGNNRTQLDVRIVLPSTRSQRA